jgi:hypothetical protein
MLKEHYTCSLLDDNCRHICTKNATAINDSECMYPQQQQPAGQLPAVQPLLSKLLLPTARLLQGQ